MSQNPSSFTPTPYEPSAPASFTPTQGNYKNLQPFRYWCQKVLPLVYDDSLSYYELLCKVVDYLNKTMEDVETLHDDVDNLHNSYVELQNDYNAKYAGMTEWINQSYQDLVTFVNTYFANLDVQEEIDTKLDAMALDGTLSQLIAEYIYPTPIYVDNVSEMSDEKAIYINGQNGYLYRWNGTEFENTGIIYSSGVVQLIGTAKAINGKMILTKEDNLYSITWEGDPRLTIKNGYVMTPNTFSFEIPSSGMYYVLINAESNTIVVERFNNVNKYCSPQYSVLFGCYSENIIPYDIEILTSLPFKYNAYKKATIVQEINCHYADNILTIHRGRIALSNGQVLTAIGNVSYTNPTPSSVMFFGYDKLNSEYGIYSYNNNAITNGTIEIILALYDNKVSRDDVSTDDIILDDMYGLAYMCFGSASLSKSGTTYTIVFSNDARLILKNGILITPTGTYTVTIEQTGLKYV